MVNRIRELLDIRQLSPTQFADLIGVGRPVISHILSERNKPSLEVVQKVISAFPDVSLSWLMSGTGPMLTGATPTPTTPTNASLPISSITTAAPIAQVQSAVLPEASPTLVAPLLAVPAPIALVAAAPAPAPLPVAAFIPPAAQPSRLPQPPKFRPAQAAPHAAPATAAFAPAQVLPTGPIAAPQVATSPAAPAPTPISKPIAPPSVSVSPVPPVLSVPAPPTVTEVPLAAPVYSASIESATVAPVSSAVPAPLLAGTAEALPPTAPNPAAAFSFLGEAGKTIRRIVLFYSDGSFSDYRPEGQ